MDDDPRAWIAALPAALARQAALLAALLDRLGPDPRWDWLELGCSVPAGRGDELSDLDVGLGYAGDPPADDEVTGLLYALAPVVDHQLQDWAGNRRWWVYYRDGAQLDLLVVPAQFRRNGRARGSVALLDRSGRLASEVAPRSLRATPAEPREWLLEGWESLSNLVKYVHRGSLLEALDQLHRGRACAYRLFAHAAGVDCPGYGLTSLLDDPRAPLPEGVHGTYAPVDRAAILVAASRLAELLAATGRRAGVSSPLGPVIAARLTTLRAPSERASVSASRRYAGRWP